MDTHIIHGKKEKIAGLTGVVTHLIKKYNGNNVETTIFFNDDSSYTIPADVEDSLLRTQISITEQSQREFFWYIKEYIILGHGDEWHYIRRELRKEYRQPHSI